MKVSTEKIPDAQVLMTIEVEKERVDQARGRALKKLAPKANVPGFRPGKAPAPMVERYFGEERVLDEALDMLLPEVYRDAVLADDNIDPIARPRLVVETVDPLVVKATIPVRPTIELGDYRAVRIETEPVVVGEDRVDDYITGLRRRAATHEPVERELRWRDIVRMDVLGTIEVEGAAPTLVDAGGNPLLASKTTERVVDQKDIEVQLIDERDVLFPGFEEQLLGRKKGESVEFDLDIPDDISAEKLRGKACHFTVTVHETKEEVLPDLNDDFAKEVGDYDSVDALRARVRDVLTRAEQDETNNKSYDEILEKLVAQATVEYPPVLVDDEITYMLRDQASRIGATVDQYIAALGKSPQEVYDDLKPIADDRLRRSLVLSRIAETEQVEVADADVDAEIERMLTDQGTGDVAKRLRQLFESEDGRATVRRNLLTRRTLQRLLEIAAQDGAVAPPEERAETPRARKGKKSTETAENTAEEATDLTGA